jgi:hypothetical protein
MITAETVVDGRGAAPFELRRFFAVENVHQNLFERASIELISRPWTLGELCKVVCQSVNSLSSSAAC